jgi:hypothetical protein
MEFGNEFEESVVINPGSIIPSQFLIEQQSSPGILHSLTCFVGFKEWPLDVHQDLEFCKSIYAMEPHFCTSYTPNSFFQEIVAPVKHSLYNSCFEN